MVSSQNAKPDQKQGSGRQKSKDTGKRNGSGSIDRSGKPAEDPRVQSTRGRNDHSFSSSIVSSEYSGRLANPTRLQFTAQPGKSAVERRGSSVPKRQCRSNYNSNSFFNVQPSVRPKETGMLDRAYVCSGISGKPQNDATEGGEQREQLSAVRQPHPTVHFACGTTSQKPQPSSFCQSVINKVLAMSDRRVEVEYLRISSSPFANQEKQQSDGRSKGMRQSDSTKGTSEQKRDSHRNAAAQNNPVVTKEGSKPADESVQWIVTEASRKKPEFKGNRSIYSAAPGQVAKEDRIRAPIELAESMQSSTLPSTCVDAEESGRSSSSGVESFNESLIRTSPATVKSGNLTVSGSDVSVAEVLTDASGMSSQNSEIRLGVQEIRSNPRISKGIVGKSHRGSGRNSNGTFADFSPANVEAAQKLTNALQKIGDIPSIQPTASKNDLRTSKSCFSISNVQAGKDEQPLQKTKSCHDLQLPPSSRWLVDAAREMERINQQNVEIGRSATSLISKLARSSSAATDIDKGASVVPLSENPGAAQSSSSRLAFVGLKGQNVGAQKVASSTTNSTYDGEQSYNHPLRTEVRMLVDNKPYAVDFEVTFNTKSQREPEVKVLELLINSNQVWRREPNSDGASCAAGSKNSTLAEQSPDGKEN